MAQAHGGALMRGGTPEGSLQGGLAHAERRRTQRDEAIDDAVTGHIEKLSAIMGQLVEEAGGEQYRVSAVLQFRAEGERPLKVPSPPAPTAVFAGVCRARGPLEER